MKKRFVLLLNVALLNFIGCYSFKELPNNYMMNNSIITFDGDKKIIEYPDSLISKNDIQIILDRDVKIFSKIGYHSSYFDTTAFIVGTGYIYTNDNVKRENFIGQVSKQEIDSIQKKNNYIYTWMNGNRKIIFEQKNYQESESTYEKGILITDMGYPLKVPFRNIRAVEIRQINVPVTIVTSVLGVALLVGVILGIKAVFDISSGDFF